MTSQPENLYPVGEGLYDMFCLKEHLGEKRFQVLLNSKNKFALSRFLQNLIPIRCLAQ